MFPSDPLLNILILFSLLGRHCTDMNEKFKKKKNMLISAIKIALGFQVPLTAFKSCSYFHAFIRVFSCKEITVMYCTLTINNKY